MITPEACRWFVNCINVIENDTANGRAQNALGKLMALTWNRHENIVGFKVPKAFEGDADFVAYHIENMEVAAISEQVFNNLSNPAEKTIVDEIADWNASLHQDQSSSDDLNKNKIKSVNLNVTQICNLHCTYCAAGGDGSYGDPVKQISVEKTLPQLKFFMDKLSVGDRFHVSFLGGEPLLYPEGIELICEYVTQYALDKKLKPTFKITTNGTLLNDKIISILKTYKPSFVISMDGPPEINDVLRPQKNKESTSKAILENLNRIFSIKAQIGVVSVHAVFSKQHLDVMKTYKFFSEFAFDSMDFMFSVTENDRAANERYIQEMEKVAALAWQKGKEQELRKIYIFDHYFDLLDDQRKLKNHCGLGKTLAVIDSRNRIFNCPWTVGNAKDQIGKDLVLDTPKLESYTADLIDRNNCQTCWAKYLCGGGCSFIHHSTHNNVDVRKNELFCERTRDISGLAIYYFSLSRELMT